MHLQLIVYPTVNTVINLVLTIKAHSGVWDFEAWRFKWATQHQPQAGHCDGWLFCDYGMSIRVR